MAEVTTATRINKIAYSFATLGSALVSAAVTIFAYSFYLGVYGNFMTENPLVPFYLGTALAIGWWVQAIMNPIAGWISDRKITRYGRRKIWLLVGAPILALSAIGIYFPPSPDLGFFLPIIWLTGFFGLFNAAFAATVVVYLAMIPEIALTPEDRTSISTYRQFFYLIGTISGALIGALIEFELLLVIVLALFSILAFYVAAFGTKEPTIAEEKAPSVNIFTSMKITLQNKPFVHYLGFTIFATAFQSMLIQSLPVFGKQVIFKGNENDPLIILGNFLPGAFVITAIIAIVPAMYIINRIGKRKATIYGLIMAMVITPFLFTVGMIPGMELIQTLIIVLLLGFPAAPLLILPDSIISDITDYDEAVHGKRREAMHFATQGILTRFAGGLSIWFMGILHTVFGASYPGVLGLLLTGPVASIFLIIGIIIFWRYPEEEVLEAHAKKSQF
ncbi:MAG: MFS transporter [Promethearchaeota archaeon]